MKPGLLVFLVFAALASSCRSVSPSPYRTPDERSRCTVDAERLSREGAELAENDPAKAEVLFRDSLTKDLFYGPAHNNLGVLYLKQKRLYEAANEFEWAKKLMPGHPDPRVNLGLTLEMAGKIEDALASYGAALEVYPDYLPGIEGLASLTVRAGRKDERLPSWLDAIALRGETDAWKDWARLQLLKAN
jgi:tetratricopeptide (TPR) repeat protein